MGGTWIAERRKVVDDNDGEGGGGPTTTWWEQAHVIGFKDDDDDNEDDDGGISWDGTSAPLPLAARSLSAPPDTLGTICRTLRGMDGC